MWFADPAAGDRKAGIACLPKSLQIWLDLHPIGCWQGRTAGANRLQEKNCRPLRYDRWRRNDGGDMAIEEDDRPRKKISHEIGQDLSLLSVEELTERIALLASEIERLQTAAAKKRASKEAANNVFKS
jgi:uncharacterized small protein (DUF1192 family)